MKTPDWTHFRSAEQDPQGPCCLLEQAFPLQDLPRNYIWTLGYLGQWVNAEEAEIAAQVKSYSRDYILDRQKKLEEKREMARKKQEEYQRLMETRARENALETESAFKEVRDVDALKQRIEAGPLQMAKSLLKSATDLATGGVTDPQERMEICSKCPFKGDDNRCGKCGCFLPAKTRVKKSSCPIGRW